MLYILTMLRWTVWNASGQVLWHPLMEFGNNKFFPWHGSQKFCVSWIVMWGSWLANISRTTSICMVTLLPGVWNYHQPASIYIWVNMIGSQVMRICDILRYTLYDIYENILYLILSLPKNNWLSASPAWRWSSSSSFLDVIKMRFVSTWCCSWWWTKTLTKGLHHFNTSQGFKEYNISLLHRFSLCGFPSNIFQLWVILEVLLKCHFNEHYLWIYVGCPF